MNVVPATAENIRNMLVLWRETGELMTLEAALRRVFDKAYDDPEVKARWAKVFEE